MVRAALSLAFYVLVGGVSAFAPATGHAHAQADPAVLERVIPAAVQIAIVSTVMDDGAWQYIPTASGTVISSDGLILTNAHAVDMTAHQTTLDDWAQQAAERGESFSFTLDPGRLLILGSDGLTPAQPRYMASVIAQDPASDLAILQVVADAVGVPVDSATLSFAWVPLGDSDAVRLAEPVDVFGYPTSGGDALTYTAGVVSGFAFEPGSDDRAWINTDATISGGSSGGTAVNRAGELIGIPTQGSELDCRPGDTNRDGKVTTEDIGCIPVGGSIGQLRPVNLVHELLATAGRLQSVESPSLAGDSISTCPVGPIEVLSEPPGASGVTGTEGMLQPVAESGTPSETIPGAFTMMACGYEQSVPTPVFTSIASGDSFEVVSRQDAASCATGAVYPVGTTLVLVGNVDGFLPDPDAWLPVGTLLETLGQYSESGQCDKWPVRVTWVSPFVEAPDGHHVLPVGAVGFVDERTVASGGRGAACITSELEGVPGLEADHPLLPPLCEE